MDETLTWGDAEKYFQSEHAEGSSLAPDRLALVQRDLAGGKDSLVVQYTVLRLDKLTKSIDAFDALCSDDLSSHDVLMRLAEIRSKRSKQHPDAGRNYDMPLSEKIAELRREAASEKTRSGRSMER